MYDLIYVENRKDYHEVAAIIHKRYPEAQIEDASDFIHLHRFSVDGEIPEDEWVVFLMTEGLWNLSLHANLIIQSDYERAKRLIDIAKAYEAG